MPELTTSNTCRSWSPTASAPEPDAGTNAFCEWFSARLRAHLRENDSSSIVSAPPAAIGYSAIGSYAPAGDVEGFVTYRSASAGPGHQPADQRRVFEVERIAQGKHLYRSGNPVRRDPLALIARGRLSACTRAARSTLNAHEHSPRRREEAAETHPPQRRLRRRLRVAARQGEHGGRRSSGRRTPGRMPAPRTSSCCRSRSSRRSRTEPRRPT